jgi:acetyltransferase-like isoleucine patch superfamily enzyme
MDRRGSQQIKNAWARFSVLLKGSPARSPGVSVGRHTYGHDERTFQVFLVGARIEVGAFCSIGPQVRVLAGSDHVTTRASTFPLNARLFEPAKGNMEEAIEKGPTVIGNDVWIGLGATILSGVMVGDGAVVGAGAVVSKSVPPYAVVVGNPAQIVHYRFDSDIRRRLLELRWWNWEDREIRDLKRWFMADVESFLEEMERVHEPRAESDLTRRLREAPPEFLTPHSVDTSDANH